MSILKIKCIVVYNYYYGYILCLLYDYHSRTIVPIVLFWILGIHSFLFRTSFDNWYA